MNWIIRILFCSTNFWALSQDSLVKIENFGTNPGNLEMFIHLPSQTNSVQKPLVIALHGCNQRANDMAFLTGWNNLADKHNFVVIYPQQKFSNNSSFCFNWFKDKDIKGDQGEITSIKQMIDHALKMNEIDPSQIYITGLSAGAAMSVAMLVNFPDIFKAGATFAGGPFGIAENSVSTGFKMMRGTLDVSQEKLISAVNEIHAEPVEHFPSLFIYHGNKDQVVNIQNANWLIEQWTGIHACDSKADSTIKEFDNIKDLERTEYWNEQGVAVVTFYKINGIGHVLPIDPGNSEKQGGNAGMFSTDIDFYSTYQVAKDFGLIQK